jgi:hypothetical protein
LELAAEGFSHGQSPLRIEQPPCPSTPTNHPSTTLWPSHLLSSSTLARETTRRVHRSHASSTPTAHHHHLWQLLPFPHSTIALAADPAGSSEPAYAPRVCLRVTSAPALSYVGRRTSYTLQLVRVARRRELLAFCLRHRCSCDWHGDVPRRDRCASRSPQPLRTRRGCGATPLPPAMLTTVTVLPSPPRARRPLPKWCAPTSRRLRAWVTWVPPRRWRQGGTLSPGTETEAEVATELWVTWRGCADRLLVAVRLQHHCRS